MRIALLLLAGCYTAPSPPPVTPPTPVTPAKPARLELLPHCPPLSYNMVGWWGAEIMPGCQEPPLEHSFTMCAGKPCDQPCRTKTTVAGNVSVYKHTFVDGKWTETATGPGGYNKRTCTYDGNVRTTCDALGDTWTAKRDESGHIIAIATARRSSEIRYDDRGRVSSIDGDAITYDADGRMTKFGAIAFTWDDRGRVLREEDNKRRSTFEYDDKNRVVKIAVEEAPKFGDYIITYDGDRVTGWSFDNVSSQFEYCD